MKLKINIELPISSQNEGLVQIVAQRNGWEPDGIFPSGLDENGSLIMGQVTADFYVTNIMLKPFLSSYIENEVDLAHKWYFGKSGEESLNQVKSKLKQELIVGVEFINE